MSKRISVNVQTGAITESTLTDAEKAQNNIGGDAEIANQYKDFRRKAYPNLGEFADAMYWNSKGDASKLTAYYAACEKVKTDNPKP